MRHPAYFHAVAFALQYGTVIDEGGGISRLKNNAQEGLGSAVDAIPNHVNGLQPDGFHDPVGQGLHWVGRTRGRMGAHWITVLYIIRPPGDKCQRFVE